MVKQKTKKHKRRLRLFRKAHVNELTKRFGNMKTGRMNNGQRISMLNTGSYDPKAVEEADAADAANDVYAREYQEMDVETPINSQEMSAVMPFSFAAASFPSPTEAAARAQAAEAAATAQAAEAAEAAATAQAAEAAARAADVLNDLANSISRMGVSEMGGNEKNKNEINMNEIGGGYRKNKSRRHKTRRHKSRRHKTRRHKTRRHKSRR